MDDENTETESDDEDEDDDDEDDNDASDEEEHIEENAVNELVVPKNQSGMCMKFFLKLNFAFCSFIKLYLITFVF